MTPRRRNFKTQQLLVILDLRKTCTGKSHDNSDGIIFEEFSFQNLFGPYEKPAFSNSSGLKSVFENSVFVTD